MTFYIFILGQGITLCYDLLWMRVHLSVYCLIKYNALGAVLVIHFDILIVKFSNCDRPQFVLTCTFESQGLFMFYAVNSIGGLYLLYPTDRLLCPSYFESHHHCFHHFPCFYVE